MQGRFGSAPKIPSGAKSKALCLSGALECFFAILFRVRELRTLRIEGIVPGPPAVVYNLQLLTPEVGSDASRTSGFKKRKAN